MNGVIKFSDIIKKRFLEDMMIGGNLTITRVVITLLLTFLATLFVYYIYRKTFSGTLYSRSFNISLIMVSLVTALIIMPITSNLTLSLGMVGALSIVRFRTALKDPNDITYMFWAIAVGLTMGAGFYSAAAAGTFVIGMILLILHFIKPGGFSSYLLILHFSHESSEAVNESLRKLPHRHLKSKTVTGDGLNL